MRRFSSTQYQEHNVCKTDIQTLTDHTSAGYQGNFTGTFRQNMLCGSVGRARAAATQHVFDCPTLKQEQLLSSARKAWVS